MNFVSLIFFVFLPVVWLLFYIVPQKWRVLVLLLASYIFYATWSVPFILVILLSTTVDYWMSHVINKHRHTSYAKYALAVGIVSNILGLVFFKYANFLLANVSDLAQLAGVANPFPQQLAILLPLGISFYTFEALSYLLDVYRGQAPAKNFLHYNFYIMFFPHLISGPIIRYNELALQYAGPLALPSAVRFRKGLELILLGCFFKLAIADQFALWVDPVFLAATHASSLAVWIGVLAFTVQIYFDFMGYTHIARGVALLFNIELPLNFNHPYNAPNLREFWNRWHMSLSRWIRDYLFIPLGGSRATTLRVCFNLIIVMSIAGIWHGASWLYMIWGAYHGMILALCYVWKSAAPNLRQRLSALAIYRVACLVMTFLIVMLGWVFFRANDLQQALLLVGRLVNLPAAMVELQQAVAQGNYLPLATIVTMLMLCFSGPWVVQKVQAMRATLPYWCKASAAYGMVCLTWVMAASDAVPFIYFQF